MLKTAHIVKTPAVESLIGLWQQRYFVDISDLSSNRNESCALLVENTTPATRSNIVAKLKDSVLDLNCQMAWIQTKNLYSYIPNVLDLNEARRITQFAFRVYRKLLDLYQEESTLELEENSTPSTYADIFQSQLPAIDRLAYKLEPTLILFQEQHLASKDWRALGFMTTQLNFCNQLIFNKLDRFEKISFSPYLKFVEEQVALPWQRVCAAAARYEENSPEIILLQRILPLAQEIAEAVYQKLIELLPHHCSRRGYLTDSGIKHSCLRDLNMFQAYLWLCFLEKNLEPIEQELVPLCTMVVESVGIRWEMTQKWCQILGIELESHLQESQKDLFVTYIKGMQDIFERERSQLGCQEVIFV